MSNMSYCRFRNTLLDLQDCEEHINDPIETDDDENDDGTVTTHEDRARKQLIQICRNIVEMVGET